MKKILITMLAVLFTSIMLNAQHNELKNLFDKYGVKDGFEMEKIETGIEIDNDDIGEILAFIKDADNMYILNYDFKKGKKSDHSKLLEKLKKIINKYDFNSIMEVSDEDDLIKMLLCKDENERVTDLLMLISDEEEATYIWATVN